MNQQSRAESSTALPRTPEQIDAVVHHILSTPIHAHFGLRLIAMAPGESTLAFVAGPQTQMAGGGRVHGGVLSLLLEPPALMASIGMIPADCNIVTADIHIGVLRPVPPGAEVTLRGRVIRPGRTLFFCESEAWVGDRLCASARLTTAVVPEG